MKLTIDFLVFSLVGLICLSFFAGEVVGKPASHHFECPEEASGYVIDPKNCSVYYNCQNGVAMDKLHCGAGTLFNPALIQCVDPKDAPCAQE